MAASQVPVTVISSKHSNVTPGMKGRGIEHEDGWEVTLTLKYQSSHTSKAVDKEVTIWFNHDEISSD